MRSISQFVPWEPHRSSPTPQVHWPSGILRARVKVGSFDRAPHESDPDSATCGVVRGDIGRARGERTEPTLLPQRHYRGPVDSESHQEKCECRGMLPFGHSLRQGATLASLRLVSRNWLM